MYLWKVNNANDNANDHIFEMQTEKHMKTWLIIAVMHTTQAEKKIGIQEMHNKHPLQSCIFNILLVVIKKGLENLS